MTAPRVTAPLVEPLVAPLVAQVGTSCKPGGKAAHLSATQRLALVAVANRCDPVTRQGRVSISHVQDLAGVSRATAYRIRDKLVAAGYLTIMDPGRRIPHHGKTPPLYEVAPFLLTLPTYPRA